MRPLDRRLQRGRALRLEAMEPRLFLSADYANLTGLSQVQTEYGFTGSGQTVALIDTGIAYDHTAISDGYGEGHRVVGGYDFAENDSDPYDDSATSYHGTHVAGVISSTNALAPGVAQGADLVALRVFDDQGVGQLTWVEQALQWVHTHRNSFANPITTVNLSLGSVSATAADWAALDDEFAQLEADGIFIAVAAGNSFATNQTTGLSSPATSSHVVPVASVDASGSLSYFSQRDSRVIAAPGRGILSTVPDSVGNHNGVNDDFATYSGTSMASPYVAAASMLLRQAYAFAGIANVNQQMLYNTMIATADVIYDSVTGANYYRLNIDRAIDSVMPSDDYGSAALAATRLGTLADNLSVSGAIGKIADRDWFSFKASASGKVTLAVDDTGGFAAQWHFASTPADLLCSGNTVTFTVVAGQTYTFGLSNGTGLSHYTLDLRLDAARNAAALIAQAGQEVRVTGTAGDDAFALSVGDVYRLTVNGVEYKYDRSAVNSFVFDGGTGSDSIVVQAAAGNATASLRPSVIDVSAAGYKVHGIGIEDATIRAGAGSSRAALYDSLGNDTLTATPSYAQLSGSGYVNRVEGFCSVSVSASSGYDVAWLYDSVGNDTLSLAITDTTLSGRGFSNRARFFDEVHATSDAGGYDTAVVYGAVGETRIGGTGKQADVSFSSSAASSTSARTSKASLVGFKYLRAVASGGKITRSQLAAIDFVLDVTNI